MLRSSWSVLITKIISSIEEFDYLIWYLRLKSVDNKMSNEGIALKSEMIIRENAIRYDFLTINFRIVLWLAQRK